MIGAVVLAAGQGVRFGGGTPKVLALLEGVPLVRHVVDRLGAGGVGAVVVTSGADGAGVRDAVAGTGAVVVEVDPAGGMSASIRTGVAALPADCAAFVIALGDQPRIDPGLVRRLVETWEQSTSAAVVPVYAGGVRGHPVLFDATMRRRLTGDALAGDRGARDVLDALGDRVVWLEVAAPVPIDVDTAADLDRLSS